MATLKPVSTPTVNVNASPITQLSNIALDSGCKLSQNQFLGSNDQVIGLPVSGGTLAKLSDIPSDYVKISQLNSATDTLDRKISLANTDIDTLTHRVDGMTPALVFDTVEQMNEWLSIAANTDTLIVGQNLYIRATDVPDYWWDGSKACELETAKIDLTSYALNQTVLDEYATLQTQLLYFETRVQCLIAYLERTKNMTDLESIIDNATEQTFNKCSGEDDTQSSQQN